MVELIEQFPSTEQKALVYSLNSNCSEIVKMKVKELRQRSETVAYAVCVTANIPLLGILESNVAQYAVL